MQNENLLVNSKTDILEFKRKHNLLVGKGTIKTTVSNIKQLTNAEIENLSCGDVVLKEDSSGKHAYLVSFKSATGLCLTYCDASCVETQSYDKIEDNWVYNSEDKSGNLIDDVKPIYWHGLELYDAGSNRTYITCHILSNSETLFDSWAKIVDFMKKDLTKRFVLEAHGIIYNGGEIYELLSLYRRPNEETINASVRVDDGFAVISDVNIGSLISTVNDGVNKIN